MACFKLSRNFKPMVVVVSGVSASVLALGVSCAHASAVSIVHCASLGRSALFDLCAHCGGGSCCRGLGGEERRGEGRCRSLVAGRWSNQPVARSPPPPLPHRAHHRWSQAFLQALAPADPAANMHKKPHIPVLSAASTVGSRFRAPQHHPLSSSQRSP